MNSAQYLHEDPAYSEKEEVASSNSITSGFLDMIDPNIGVLDDASCDNKEPRSAGCIEWAIKVLQTIGRYLWEGIQNTSTVLAQYAKLAWQEAWASIEQADLQSKANTLRCKFSAGLGWLQAKVYEKHIQTYSFLLIRHDIWICHSSTLWLNEKTGYSAETIVHALAGCLLLALAALLYKLLSKLGRRRRRGMERAASMTFSHETTRGARDRGFSLDLSATHSSTTSITRSRVFSFDFFRKSKLENPQPTGNRDRGNSLDLFNTQDPGLGDDLNNPNHAIGQGHASRPTAKIVPLVIYYGPTESKLLYSTWTPPPSWTEASRSLMPHDTRIKLQRELSLDLSKDRCKITIREPTSTQTPLVLAVVDCSIHVKAPLIGGVLEIYVKESPKEEWLEHTFDTAKNAAQFQIDMLALQLFGPTLHRMYQTLELIHQGSMACEGWEYVCHHNQMRDDKPQGVGVAWDDAMRALGSNVPSLRVALERVWWQHYSMNSLKLRARKRARKKHGNKGMANPSVGNGPSEAEEVGDEPVVTGVASKKETAPAKNHNEYIHLTKDYVRRRLLLGPVDFFRLFVPCVPSTALPNNEATQKRMAQLLRWRKRAATAAILVQGYVKARIVVNMGWVLSRPLPTHYLTRRLAFDDNIDNSQRDSCVKNEYYEATVSRDVLSFVRPSEPDAFKPRKNWMEYLRPRKLRTAISKYQAFTLVGNHVFKIPQDDKFPLSPAKDPVLTFGSLRQMIADNPDLDFMVMAFFPNVSKVCYVNVFVRSLPRGIDPAFDRNMSRFKHGSKEIRDKKLSITVQVGSSETKTWTEIAIIAGFTYLMRSVAGDLDASTPNAALGPSDRTPFPMIPMGRFGETHHFGGALQSDRKQPQNYCSATINMDSEKASLNPLTRLFMNLIEKGFMSKNVYDITYVLAANEQDELPERALSTVRFARVAANDIALPSIFVYGSSRCDFRRASTWNANNFKSALTNFSCVGDRLRVLADFPDTESDEEMLHNSSLVNRVRETTDSEWQRKRQRAEKLLEARKAKSISTVDPMEKAVNELVDILVDVKIPVRRDQLPMYDFAAAVPVSLLEAHNTVEGTLSPKELLNLSLLLLVSRKDIQRHYIASGCHLKKAAIRIVETAAWRGQTFPIDKRMCRIELQSGQFFQQGTDLCGRPVFYFRNMGLGPWRKDNDASVAAVLDRLEGALWEFSQYNDSSTCTLVVIMGKPYREYFKKGVPSDTASSGGDAEDEPDEMDTSNSVMSVSFKECNENSPDGRRMANPRVNPDEVWQLHTSKKLLRQMVTLISAHYPERLHQVLVVLKPAQTISLRKFMGSWRLSNLVDSPVTRSKVKFLNTFHELQGYVSKQELIAIAGGERPVNPEVFGLPD